MELLEVINSTLLSKKATLTPKEEIVTPDDEMDSSTLSSDDEDTEEAELYDEDTEEAELYDEYIDEIMDAKEIVSELAEMRPGTLFEVVFNNANGNVKIEKAYEYVLAENEVCLHMAYVEPALSYEEIGFDYSIKNILNICFGSEVPADLIPIPDETDTRHNINAEYYGYTVDEVYRLIMRHYPQEFRTLRKAIDEAYTETIMKNEE